MLIQRQSARATRDLQSARPWLRPLLAEFITLARGANTAGTGTTRNDLVLVFTDAN